MKEAFPGRSLDVRDELCERLLRLRGTPCQRLGDFLWKCVQKVVLEFGAARDHTSGLFIISHDGFKAEGARVDAP